jgi:DNA-binding transcriptional LysR family regulator
MRSLDLRLLGILDALIAERNVTRTAERLHMTQPAVSHALAKLRRAFGDPLFVPTRGGMAPTSRALEIAAPARTALEAMGQAFAKRAAFAPAAARQTFRVATNDYVSFMLLPKLLRRLRDEAPGVRLQISAFDPARDWVQLEHGTLDFAVAYFKSVPGGLHSRGVFAERYCCIARRGHPAIRKRLTLAQYLALEHIVMSPFITGLVDERLAEQGKRRQVALAIPQFLLIPELVAQTDFLATMGERVARRFAARLPLQVFPLPLAVERVAITLVWHPRRHAELGHQWLRGVIAGVAKSV